MHVSFTTAIIIIIIILLQNRWMDVWMGGWVASAHFYRTHFLPAHTFVSFARTSHALSPSSLPPSSPSSLSSKFYRNALLYPSTNLSHHSPLLSSRTRSTVSFFSPLNYGGGWLLLSCGSLIFVFLVIGIRPCRAYLLITACSILYRRTPALSPTSPSYRVEYYFRCFQSFYGDCAVHFLEVEI